MANVTITNPSPSSVNWTAIPPSNVSGFFSATPSSGALKAGASVKVTIAFNRVSASDYGNTLLFPETSDFSHAITFTASNTTLSVNVTGRVTRAPLIRETTLTFWGMNCVNSKVATRALDESGIKSVTGTATIYNNDGTTATRSLVFIDEGSKIGWTSNLNDLASKAVEVAISGTVTDNLGLTTSINITKKRPTTC